MESLP